MHRTRQKASAKIVTIDAMAKQHDHGHIRESVVVTKATWPRFIVRVLANALGLWLAAEISKNIDYDNSVGVILIAALIFSIINAFVRPILVIFTLPAIILTLGLFMLVVNGLMVWLVSALYSPFEVRTFGAAILAAIIVWLVNYALSVFMVDSQTSISREK